MKRSWLEKQRNEQREQRLRVLERRKLLAEQLRQTSEVKSKVKTEQSSDPAPVPVLAPTLEIKHALEAPSQLGKPKARFGVSSIHMYMEGQEPAKVDKPLTRLIDLYLETAHDRSRRVALLWPGTLTALPLVHVLATRERWEIDDRLGVRGLIYPVKGDSFVPLNDIYLDRADLISWIQKRESRARYGKKEPIRPCRPKDLLLFQLQELSDVPDVVLNPCLNELVAHFVARDDGGWSSYGHRYLENLRGRLRRNKHKGYSKKLGEGLGDARTSPDALFALHHAATKSQIEDALESLKSFNDKSAFPEVVLLDARRAMCKKLINWRKTLRRFLEMYAKFFDPTQVGVLIVTDDPNVSKWAIEELSKADDERRSVKWTLVPVLAPGCTSGLHRKGDVHGLVGSLRPPGIRITLIDEYSSRLVNSLYRTLQKLSLPREHAKPIYNVMTYLQRLSTFPGGIRHLNSYLTESQSQGWVRDKRSWVACAAEADAFIKSDKGAPRRDELEQVMKQANQLVSDCYDHTPFALTLAEELGSAVARGERVTVILPKNLDGHLAERFLRQYSEYPDKKSYDDLSDHVRLFRGNKVEVGVAEKWADKIIFAYFDETTMRLLMTDDRIPSKSVVLLSHWSAAYLVPLFKFLLRVQEYSALHGRISDFLKQLESAKSLQGISIPTEDLGLTRLSFTPPVVIEFDDEISEADAWRVQLDDGTTLLRGEGSLLCVYDPVESDTGFRRIKVNNLEVGNLVVPSVDDDLQDAMEDKLAKVGKRLSKDDIYGPYLRDYHKNLIDKVAQKFPAKYKKEQAERLLAEMLKIDQKLKGVTSDLVRTWISVERETEKTFDEAVPHAPRKAQHYNAMMRALEFDDSRIGFWWNGAIVRVRSSRSTEGKLSSDVYSMVLTKPADARTYWGFSKETIKELAELAKSRLAAVLEISPPNPTAKTAND